MTTKIAPFFYDAIDSCFDFYCDLNPLDCDPYGAAFTIARF